MKVTLLIITVSLLCAAADAQTAVDSTDIYIKQSPGENSELPENRLQLNEQPVLNQNSIRSISLYYPEQDEWVTISSNEDLQWGTSELISETGFAAGTTPEDSVNNNNDEMRVNRLAELLGNMISNRGNEANGTDSDSGSGAAADDETMNAFREAFEAVLQEEDDEKGSTDEEDVVELPVLYGNVDGIVLDETRSKTGRDFYKAFYESWSKRDGIENSVVRVAEKPGPGLGSIVFVEVNYEEIFELRLRPGDQRTKQAGDIAAERTLNYLKEKSKKPLTY